MEEAERDRLLNSELPYFYRNVLVVPIEIKRTGRQGKQERVQIEPYDRNAAKAKFWKVRDGLCYAVVPRRRLKEPRLCDV